MHISLVCAGQILTRRGVGSISLRPGAGPPLKPPRYPYTHPFIANANGDDNDGGNNAAEAEQEAGGALAMFDDPEFREDIKT